MVTLTDLKNEEVSLFCGNYGDVFNCQILHTIAYQAEMSVGSGVKMDMISSVALLHSIMALHFEHKKRFAAIWLYLIRSVLCTGAIILLF